MIDYILFGLVSGLLVFISLFLLSFIALGSITVLIRLISISFNGFGIEKPSAFQEQTV